MHGWRAPGRATSGFIDDETFMVAMACDVLVKGEVTLLATLERPETMVSYARIADVRTLRYALSHEKTASGLGLGCINTVSGEQTGSDILAKDWVPVVFPPVRFT